MTMDSDVIVLLVLIGAILLLMLVFSAMIRTHRFLKWLNYLEQEINRTAGQEQEYWKREKRKLWRSVFGFKRR